MILFKKQTTKALISGLCLCCSQTPEDRFTRVETQIILQFFFISMVIRETKSSKVYLLIILLVLQIQIWLIIILKFPHRPHFIDNPANTQKDINTCGYVVICNHFRPILAHQKQYLVIISRSYLNLVSCCRYYSDFRVIHT